MTQFIKNNQLTTRQDFANALRDKFPTTNPKAIKKIISYSLFYSNIFTLESKEGTYKIIKK